MRTTALFLSLIWALGCALAYPCPKSLRVYLLAVLGENIGTEATLYGFGLESHAYAVSYAAFTMLGLLAALNVVRENLTRKWHLAVGMMAAALVVARAWPSHPWPFYMVEGGVLAFAGTALVFSLAHLEKKSIWLTLSALWLGQCVFRLGFGISGDSELWAKLNFVLPAVAVCGAYGFIGLKLAEKHFAGDNPCQY